MISSYPNSIGPSLARRMAAELEEEKRAGNEVIGIQLSDSVLAAYCESETEIKAYIAATRSSLIVTLTAVGGVSNDHRQTVRRLIRDFRETDVGQ